MKYSSEASVITENFLPDTSKVAPEEVKRLIRDVQYELTAAWKFFMGLGIDRQALIFANGFTTLPLAIARNCSHVIVHGLREKEQELLRTVAVSKQISNYTCVEDVSNLATQFDVIIFTTTNLGDAPAFPSKHDVSRLIGRKSEVWMVTTNERSVSFAKRAAKTLWWKTKSPHDRKRRNALEGVRFQFGEKQPMLSKQAKSYLETIDCKPFSQIAVAPTVINAEVVRTLTGPRNQAVNGHLGPTWRKFVSEDVVIGASRGSAGMSFLQRLLHHLPRTDLMDGKVSKYMISPGGKVLVFAKFDQRGDTRNALLKLPLNATTTIKMAKNYRLLKMLATTEHVGYSRRGFFPEPLAEGSFENQAYFVEGILSGKSGDILKAPKSENDRLAHEIFSFWSSVQESLSRSYFFDEPTFDKFISEPLKDAFDFLGFEGEHETMRERIEEYLKERFLNQAFNLSIIHGDFSDKNIIFDEPTLTLKGVIDWDMAREMAFPILDVMHYFVRSHRISYSKSPVKLLHTMIFEKKLIPEYFPSIVNMYEESFKLDKSFLGPLIIVYWMHRAAGHFGTLKNLDKSFVRRNFTEPLKIFERILSES